MNFGMFRVAAASLKLKVANPSYNKTEIMNAIDLALAENVKLLVTPELSVTGYTCGDLFFSRSLLESAEDALDDIVAYTLGNNICVVVGMPLAHMNKLYNCAVVIQNGMVTNITAKTYPANYNEFYEKRWFDSGKNLISARHDKYHCEISTQNIINICDDVMLGVEICEDLWVPLPPSVNMSLSGANLIVNLSASDEYVAKAEYRKNLVVTQSARCICAYVYAGASVYESTTDLVFSGDTLIAENGTLLARGERFQRDNIITIADIDIEKLSTLRQKNMSFLQQADCRMVHVPNLNNEENDLKYRKVNPHPFVPVDNEKRKENCKEIFSIQASGLAKRLEHVGARGCVIGISGGLDSTLALLVAVRAVKLLGKPLKSVIGVTMPGFGTTDRTYQNSIQLMNQLGVTCLEINIKNVCIQHMKDIRHNPEIKDTTYENTQARERTQILFDLANKHHSLLVGTGDLSELALGWCTYNGDHMSMYGVNASVPKTLVSYLIKHVADISEEKTKAILTDILNTPVSPELLPPDEHGSIVQKTEENIGPYELHDFFLYHFIRFGFSRYKLQRLAEKAFDGIYDTVTIEKWLDVFLKRFFLSQFKRSCVPDSPKVGSVSLSPRGDWRMPSDASFEDFLQQP